MPTDTTDLTALSPSVNGRPIRWAAATGLWSFEGEQAHYLGPAGDSPQRYGVALTDRDLTDGSVRVRIKLSSPDVSAGVILVSSPSGPGISWPNWEPTRGHIR